MQSELQILLVILLLISKLLKLIRQIMWATLWGGLSRSRLKSSFKLKSFFRLLHLGF